MLLVSCKKILVCSIKNKPFQLAKGPIALFPPFSEPPVETPAKHLKFLLPNAAVCEDIAFAARADGKTGVREIKIGSRKLSQSHKFFQIFNKIFQ